jgi:hypothetical protein
LREKFDTSNPTDTTMLQLVMVFAQLEQSMTADPKVRSGTHVLRLFPEVRPNRALEYVEERPKAEVNAGQKLKSGRLPMPATAPIR